MATEIKIPIPDQTTEEVRIVKWQKNQGDTIMKDEIVLEVETDKSVIEVEAIAEGVLLKQMFAVDDMVPVGEVVGLIGSADEKVGQAAPEKTVPPATQKSVAPATAQVTAAATGQAVTTTTTGARIFASPNAKRIARELGVDINQIPGSGPNGRIIAKDVKKHAASAPATPAVAAALSTCPADDQPQPGTSVAMTKMRRAIGLNLQMSARETPHFNVTISIDMTRAMEIRKELNESRPKEGRISVNDLVVRACAIALQQYPAVNSRFEEDEIHYMADINIGVATAVADGLVVPVLTHAHNRGWDDMAAETKRLANEARGGKIIGAGKGTFTVSNLGMFGVDSFTAIINPPESAILAVGAVKNEVVDIGGGIGIRPMMAVILCSDHRIIDGSLAARFLQALKLYLEEQISANG